MMKTLVDPSKRWEMEKHTDKLRGTSACILHSPHVHIVGPRRDVRVWVNVMPDDIVLVTNGTFDSHVQVMGLKIDDKPFIVAQQGIGNTGVKFAPEQRLLLLEQMKTGDILRGRAIFFPSPTDYYDFTLSLKSFGDGFADLDRCRQAQ